MSPGRCGRFPDTSQTSESGRGSCVEWEREREFDSFPPRHANWNGIAMASAAVRSPLHQAHSTPHSDEESESETEQLATKLEEIEIDVESLNPLSPEVISKQATINIGQSRPSNPQLHLLSTLFPLPHALSPLPLSRLANHPTALLCTSSQLTATLHAVDPLKMTHNPNANYAN